MNINTEVITTIASSQFHIFYDVVVLPQKNLLIPINFSLNRKSTRIRKFKTLSIRMNRGFSSILKPLNTVMTTIKMLVAKIAT